MGGTPSAYDDARPGVPHRRFATVVALLLSTGLVLAVGVVSGSWIASGVATAQATGQSTAGPTLGSDGDQALQGSTAAGPRAAVANQAPSASLAYSPSSPGVGEQVTFDASSSSDPDGTIVQYRWDFGNDGSIDRQTSGPTTTRQYSGSGPHAVRVVVVDDAGATDAATTTVTVAANQPPTASFDFAPSEPAVGEVVTFDASSASDSDGTVVQYRWDFDDDGSIDRQTSSATVTNQYASAGSHTARLVVVDDEGATGSASKTLTVVSNQPPAASFDYAPTVPTVGELVTFDAGDSSDSDGAIVEFRWDFDGDGSVDRTTTTATASNQFTTSGTYAVALEVVDDDGSTDTASTTVTVGANQPPVAAFSYAPDDVTVDEAITFDASGSSDPDGTVVEYRWDFDGDGTFEDVTTAAETQHTFDRSGTYSVSLLVVDDDGTSVQTTDSNVEVAAAGPSPVARCTLSAETVSSGETLTIDASGSENAALVKVDVDGYGSFERTDQSDLVVSVTYGDPGTFSPRVQAVGDGAVTDSVVCGEVEVEETAGSEPTSSTTTPPLSSASRTTTSAGSAPSSSEPSTSSTTGQPGFGAAIAVLVLVFVMRVVVKNP